MNNKVNYKFIGLSVLFGFFLMMTFIYWLMKPSANDETQNYLIYFDESVSGLNINAPVKYRGISVGKVVDLRINPLNTAQVQATVKLLKTTPIKETTVAKLTAQGITGLTYINLSLGSNDAPSLVVKDGERYPVIKTVPSLFKNVENSLGELSTQLTGTLAKTNDLLDEKNQKEIARILKRTANVTQHIDELLNDETVMHLQSSAKNFDEFSLKLAKLTPKVDKLVEKSILWEDTMASSFVSIKDTYSGMGLIMDGMAQSFSDVQKDVQGMTLNIVPTINESMIIMQHSMLEFNELMQEYKRSPSDLLFKETELKRGPGEK